MHLIIKGDTPSKKNQRILSSRGGRLISLPSKNYAQWHKDALWQLKGQPQITDYPIGVTIVLHPSNKRRFDLDNRATSVLDVLKDAGIIEDDDWSHIDTLSIELGEPTKEAYAEVWLDD